MQTARSHSPPPLDPSIPARQQQPVTPGAAMLPRSQLSYYDNCPDDYEPPFFQQCPDDQVRGPGGPIRGSSPRAAQDAPAPPQLTAPGSPPTRTTTFPLPPRESAHRPRRVPVLLSTCTVIVHVRPAHPRTLPSALPLSLPLPLPRPQPYYPAEPFRANVGRLTSKHHDFAVRLKSVLDEVDLQPGVPEARRRTERDSRAMQRNATQRSGSSASSAPAGGFCCSGWR